MPDSDATVSAPPRPTVFISYASQDREAARALRDALPGFGLEVWHDESELGGGEAWDQKIRRQIRECDYFMPLVSAQTEARAEGYFRREWRLAVERTLDMADDHLFLLPLVIDDTDQATARVPEKFLTVQWLKVPGGQPTRALEAMCRRVASGSQEAAAGSAAPARTPPPGRSGKSKPAARGPEFPRKEPGRESRFAVDVAAWACRWAWAKFRRLPRWVRIVASVWICIALVARCDSSPKEKSAEISPAKVAKLNAIAQKYQGSLHSGDIVKLGAEIAKTFSDDEGEGAAENSPLLAVPFSAPAGDAAAAKLADSTFAMAYGRLSISHHGQVGLTNDPLPSRELGAALERARANHSAYVLYGTVDTANNTQVLTIKIAAVADGSVTWAKSYPAAGADPAMIATEVEAKIPPLAVKPAPQ